MSTHYVSVARAMYARDLLAFKKRFKTYFINYTLINPLLYGFVFAYIMGNALLHNADGIAGTTLFAGNIVLAMLNLPFAVFSELIYDFEHARFIEYMTSILPPRLYVIHRILFVTAMGCIIFWPYFLVGKLLLGSHFVTTHTNWIALFAVIACGMLCCASYIMAAVCCIPGIHYIKTFWLRFNMPLFVLGGFWAPYHVLKAYSPALGAIMLLNPLLYITEGIRSALLQQSQFISVWICIPVLLTFAVVFTLLAGYSLRKKLDAV